MSRRTIPALCLICTGALGLLSGHWSGITRAEEEWLAEFEQPCVGPPVCFFHLEVLAAKEEVVLRQTYAPRGGCGTHCIRINDILPEIVTIASRPARLRIWSISCNGVRSLSYDWVLIDPELQCSGMSLTSHDGDANADGKVDLSDAIYLANYLYIGGPPVCVNAADVDNDAALDISDVILILHGLFGV